MKQLWTGLVVAAALLAGCASNAPRIDFDSSADFASYRTYAFISDKPLMRAPDSGPHSPLLEGRLMRITDDAMQARGYTKVSNPEAADFAIGFTVGSRDKIKVNSYPASYRPYYGGWGWGGGYYAGASTTSVSQYTEGTLAVDIYDVASHKPVWHGVAEKRITDAMRRNPSEAVTEILNEIYAGYPPGSAK